MKILLFNDNPVVQKLVALSAQKTKDELAVASSPEDIQESSCDLLIVDDALYSDETFAAIKEYVVFKSALLMATRGNAVPAGFDNVINKPFLPTDLVDTLIHIEKHIAAPVHETPPPSAADETEETPYSIDLEETLSEFESDEGFEEEEIPDSEADFIALESFEEAMPKTAILDHEEVQEVRGLLEDTDSDALMEEEEELFETAEVPELSKEDEGGEESFDFDALLGNEEDAEPDSDTSDEEFLDFGEESLPDDVQPHAAPNDVTDPYDFDVLEEESVTPLSIEEIVGEESEEEFLLDDEAFGDLELKIQEAVEDLEPADLEMEVGEEMFESFTPVSEEEDEAFFDELDLLDERELKLAIGEEIEEEPEISASTPSSIAAEALGEVMGKPVQWNNEGEKSAAESEATPVEGVEALQALLKALANEDVAKSLKGLNISININFGNNA
ncbi:MAG: hypothetical protein JXK04_05440 [Campylobacterales bacterium]|nr:hypothetical protein [Campylobacterales bacterium]